MKLKAILFEQSHSPDYSKQVESLVGKEFEFEGQKHKIIKVEHRKDFGQNYNLKVTPTFANVDTAHGKRSIHPYGPSRKFPRMLSAWLGGLSVSFSEMGMQGKDHLNVDVGPPQKGPPQAKKEDLAQLVDYAKSRGWSVVKEYPDHTLIKRKGKGEMIIVYNPATEDDDSSFSLQQWAGYGFAAISNASTVDDMLKGMQTGYAKKYFTEPKK